MEKPVYLFSDGACSGNPGPGGYGVLLRFGTNELNLSRGFRKTTNNRMELMAVIDGLRALTKAKDGLEVIIVTDSKYVVDAVEKKWVFGWEPWPMGSYFSTTNPFRARLMAVVRSPSLPSGLCPTGIRIAGNGPWPLAGR